MGHIDELRKSVMFLASEELHRRRMISFRGMLCSEQDLPTTYEAGWAWRVKVAGTYKGVSCDVDDLLVAAVDRKGKGNQDSDFRVIGCCDRGVEMAEATAKAEESLQRTIDTLKAAQNEAAELLARFCRDGNTCPITASGNRCPHNIACDGVTADHWQHYFKQRHASSSADSAQRDEAEGNKSQLDKLSILF